MSNDPVNPELRRVGRLLPRGIASDRSVRLARWVTPLLSRRAAPSDVEVHPVGQVRVRLFRPVDRPVEPSPALLWIHGGGYVVGLAAQDDALCRLYSRRTGAIIASVDYRLSPEHPSPAPLDDCYEALRWLAARPDVDSGRVAIGGASAGGGLAATLAQHAHALGHVEPVFQLLSYPMLDDRTVLRPDIDETGFRLWDNRSNRYGWRAYLGAEPGRAAHTAPAVPARAEDLAGLAPAWIGVGTLDLFHDEDVEYAQRLRAAGVECRLDVVAGAFHAFDVMAPSAAVSRAFREAQIDALTSAFESRSTSTP